MDKYEYRVKLAQIEKLVDKKDYTTAAKIADGINWRKVRSVKTLSMIADIYEETDRLEDCYEILNMIYDRSPVTRSNIYHMAEVASKMHDFEEAIDLYKEFVSIAPNDLSKYILKYQIYRDRGSSVTDQITILEEFKSHEYNEKWAYELACLYEEAGMINRCIEECDELILWFSQGEYVTKALELKMKYQELTAAQQEKYDHRFEFMGDEEETDREMFVEELPEEVFEAEDETEPEAEAVVSEEQSAADLQAEENTGTENQQKEVTEENTSAEESGELPIQTPVISTVNTGKFSTINLQKELAKGLSLIMEQLREEMPEAEEKLNLYASAEPQEKKTEPEEKETDCQLKETEQTIPESLELQEEILKYTSVKAEPKIDELLREEEDGQIGLDILEETETDKQITGQMSIGEMLKAWEQKKRVDQEKAENSGVEKESVLCETGEITGLLDDFIPSTPKEMVLKEAPERLEPVMGEQPQEQSECGAEQSEAQSEQKPEEVIFEDDLPPEIGEDAEEEPEDKSGAFKRYDTASMLDAIEKALADEISAPEVSGRYLSEDEEKIFAYFTSVNGMKKQLLKLLEEDESYANRKDSAEGNLIITGYPGNGKTTLAIDIVRAFQKQRHVKGGKLAKVTGDRMNKKDPEAVLKKLSGGALIIEHAGALRAEMVKKLSEAMEGETGGVFVILEDSSQEIRNLLAKDTGFAKKFNRSIDIPIFSNDELVAFGKSYAEEMEYCFEEMAVLALYDCIGVRQTSDHVVNITEVKEIVDYAIAHAEKKSRGLFAKLSRKRIDEYGNRLILEEDFDQVISLSR